MDEETNNFQIAKGQPQGFTLLLLAFFCQFQPDVTFKSVAYKKRCAFLATL